MFSAHTLSPLYPNVHNNTEPGYKPKLNKRMFVLHSNDAALLGSVTWRGDESSSTPESGALKVPLRVPDFPLVTKTG